MTDKEYLAEYQRKYGKLNEDEKRKLLELFHTPMTDKEYLAEYQRKYGKLNEDEKKDILNFRYNNPVSEEEMLNLLKDF